MKRRMELGDGTTKIVLNASGTVDDIDHRLKVFLDYVSGKSVDDEYIRKLDEAVRKAKMNKNWRREYDDDVPLNITVYPKESMITPRCWSPPAAGFLSTVYLPAAGSFL